MGERIAGNQARSHLIIEENPPTRARQIAKNVFFSHSGPYMKNWLIVSLVIHMSPL